MCSHIVMKFTHPDCVFQAAFVAQHICLMHRAETAREEETEEAHEDGQAREMED